MAFAIISVFSDVVDFEAARLDEKYSKGCPRWFLELNGVLVRDRVGEILAMDVIEGFPR